MRAAASEGSSNHSTRGSRRNQERWRRANCRLWVIASFTHTSRSAPSSR